MNSVASRYSKIWPWEL